MSVLQQVTEPFATIPEQTSCGCVSHRLRMFSSLRMPFLISIGNCAAITPTLLEGPHSGSGSGLSYVYCVKLVGVEVALLCGTRPRLLGLNLGVLIHSSAVLFSLNDCMKRCGAQRPAAEFSPGLVQSLALVQGQLGHRCLA